MTTIKKPAIIKMPEQMKLVVDNLQDAWKWEKMIIGRVLLQCAEGNNDAFYMVSAYLSAGDFTQIIASYAWHSMTTLISAGELVDEYIISQHAPRLPGADFDSKQMMDYLLDCYTVAPKSDAVLNTYISRVRDNALRTRLLKASDDIKTAALNRDLTIDQLIAASHELVTTASIQQNTKPIDIASHAQSFSELFQQMVAGKIETGTSTGFGVWDKIAKFKRGEVTIIAGGAGMGKTTLLLSSALIKARQLKRAGSDARILFVSMEMTTNELMMKLIQQITGIDMSNNTDILRDWNTAKKISAAITELETLPIDMTDEYRSMTPVQLRSLLHRVLAKSPIDCVMVDGLWLMSPDEPAKHERMLKPEQIYHQYLTMRLATIAREFNIPLVILHQYNQDAKSRNDKRPRITDMRDGMAIQQDFHTIYGLHRDRGADMADGDDPDTINVYGLKGRGNNRVEGAAIKLKYDGTRDLYRDLLFHEEYKK